MFFSLSTHYRRHDDGRRSLKLKGILNDKGFPTDKAFDLIPASMLPQMVRELLKLYEEKQREYEEKTKIESELRMKMQDLDFTAYHDLRALPASVKEEIDRAIDLFMRKEHDMAITKVYKISEGLVKNLFKHLYGDEELKKVRKHEDRLKIMWAIEEVEKRKYPGIRLIASLFSVILWYRNKMGAHRELEPTKEASRICLESILEAIRQLKRMGLGNTLTL